MASIRHSDTPELQRRRDVARNEIALIDAELERRDQIERQQQYQERDQWVRKLREGTDRFLARSL
jgi:hypothetical protein